MLCAPHADCAGACGADLARSRDLHKNTSDLALEIRNGCIICLLSLIHIFLTGGIAYNPNTEKYLKEYLGFIAPITVYPGEDELLALCQGALRVMTGEEKPMEY